MPTSHLAAPQTPRAKTSSPWHDEAVGDGVTPFSHTDNGTKPYSQASLGYDPDALRRLSISPFSEPEHLAARRGQPPLPLPGRPAFHSHPTTDSAVERAPSGFWARNRPVLLVFAAQLFGALMNLTARLLELEDRPMHPMQLLFVRMSTTLIVSSAYMYWKRVPDFPLGAPAVRGLLAIRGMAGFFGIFGMWVSMMYLPLAEATVITFLIPSVSGYLCYLTLRDPFTRKEQIASFLALAGVVLIARPFSFLGSAETPTVEAGTAAVAAATNATGMAAPSSDPLDDVTPGQRLMAIGVGLLGVLGGSVAFAAIRAIGTRAHPLLSVNYFSAWSTLVSIVVLLVAPMLRDAPVPGPDGHLPERGHGEMVLEFALPQGLWQWFLLICVCVCGFATQFLLTAGLGASKTKSNRATSMVYTHMLFAAGFDRFVFGHEMGTVSLLGAGLIIGSALWAALARNEASAAKADIGSHGVNGIDIEAGTRGVEMEPILAEEDSGDEDENDGFLGQNR